jgi:pseudouridylate synthase
MFLMEKYLVETALLGHGLPSVGDAQLSCCTELAAAPLVWLQEGIVTIGVLDDFLLLRRHGDQIARVSKENLENAQKQQLTAFLTASATMAICAGMGVPLVVTAGMGGIGPRPSVKTGADMLALNELPVALLATAPKDVFDQRATIAWLQASGVTVLGYRQTTCDGFLCQSEAILLDGMYTGKCGKPLLLLNAIPSGQRCISSEQLEEAMEEGRSRSCRGKEYHPAVNAALDRMSGGESSCLQLASLNANIAIAKTF